MMTALVAIALLVTAAAVVLVALALREKGDVKAGFRIGPADFFIDAKERNDVAAGQMARHAGDPGT